MDNEIAEEIVEELRILNKKMEMIASALTSLQITLMTK